LEVYVVRGIDRLRGAEDAMRDGYPSAQHRGVFHIVDAVLLLCQVGCRFLRGVVQIDVQQRRRVQHPHHLCDDHEAPLRHSQKRIECGDELFPNVLPWFVVHVIERPQQYLLFFRRPCLAVDTWCDIVRWAIEHIGIIRVGGGVRSMHPIALRYPVAFGYGGEDGLRWRNSARGGGGGEEAGIDVCGAGSRRDGVGGLEVLGDHGCGALCACRQATNVGRVGNRLVCSLLDFT